jgi:para-aminobenzoate synthetase component 1
MADAGVDALARLGGRWAWDLVDSSSDPQVLDTSGTWAVVVPYTGEPHFLRFNRWSSQAPDGLRQLEWAGPSARDWSSSMSQDGYIAAVEQTRMAIALGAVYQANICRVLSAPVHVSSGCGTGLRLAGLHGLLEEGNPAPYGGFIDASEAGVQVVTASPELFIGREGGNLSTGPIKGTARIADGLLEKDRAENIMIVDLMRNDLSRVCEVGSIRVTDLLRVEHHPGLVHLVSRVSGRLPESAGWTEILGSTFPPGSVTGAPKSSALRLIDRLEPISREFYCGAIGWVDADRRVASLAVAIRTFWVSDGLLRFGTGAGITWGSDPQAEWEETELKASRLIRLASSTWQGSLP